MNDSVFTLSNPPELSEGMTFDSTSGYRLLRRLGEGGMGEVWLAERSSAGRHSQMVAIKFLCNTKAGQILATEALRMSRLSHDNIVPFIDSGRDAVGRLFIAMAYVEGVDLLGLRELVGLNTEAAYRGEPIVRIPDSIVGFIMFMVLRALQYAHSLDFKDGVRGLIHRDVSPGNILIDEARGFVKLTDFGVAVKQSTEEASTEIAGKIPFMAPELLKGEAVDARTDIYALGLVAYELLTGFNPNIHPSGLVSIVSAITNVMLTIEKKIRSPHEIIEGINPDLSKIVVRMLATCPEERYSSAEAVLADLRSCLYNHGVGPTTESLLSYMKLVRDSDHQPSEMAYRNLSFILGSNGELNVLPQWVLTAQAAQDVAAGRNPGRSI